MVYCGKPSKGCSNCRTRKIRCDLREPGCLQCERHEQECSGYRNLVDLMFRDQSDHVIRRARTARPRWKPCRRASPAPSSGSGTSHTRAGISRGSPAGARRDAAASAVAAAAAAASPLRADSLEAFWLGRDGVSLLELPPSGLSSERARSRGLDIDAEERADDRRYEAGDEAGWSATPVGELLYALTPTFQERGTALFFAKYVTSDMSPVHQNYDFIFDIWKPPSASPGRQVDAVKAGLTAVGLASLSRLTRNPGLIDLARKSYGTALCLTNDALGDPAAAREDTTMLSVLILGTYEMLTGRTAEAMGAWQRHIDGAVLLALLRGTSQLRSGPGARMFRMLFRTVQIRSMQRDEPMPEPLVSLHRELGRLGASGDPLWRIQEPVCDMLRLRHLVKVGTLSDPDVILARLATIDRGFSTIISSLDPSWRYRTVNVPSGSSRAVVFGNVCHLYPTLGLAAAWNEIRSTRLLIQETVLEYLFIMASRRPAGGGGGEDRGACVARAAELLRRLRDGIIASIPQHFGIVSSRDTAAAHSTPNPPPLTGLPTVEPQRRQPYKLLAVPPSTRLDQQSLIKPGRPGGATLRNPNGTEESEEAARRFMVVGSAASTLVQPLYRLGLSSSCGPDVREYILNRLDTIYNETGMAEARLVALMLEDAAAAAAPGLWDKALAARGGGMTDAEAEEPV